MAGQNIARLAEIYRDNKWSQKNIMQLPKEKQKSDLHLQSNMVLGGEAALLKIFEN